MRRKALTFLTLLLMVTYGSGFTQQLHVLVEHACEDREHSHAHDHSHDHGDPHEHALTVERGAEDHAEHHADGEDCTVCQSFAVVRATTVPAAAPVGLLAQCPLPCLAAVEVVDSRLPLTSLSPRAPPAHL